MSFPTAHPGLRLGNPGSDVVCEVFIDFACPYSRKMVKALAPVVDERQDICFTFHNVIQPWHHQSLWLHEVSFAVKMIYPVDVQWSFFKELYEHAEAWYDKEIFTLNRPLFYFKIATLAADILSGIGVPGGEDKEMLKSKLLQWLIPPLQPGGNFPEEAAKSLGASPNDDENALFPLTRQIVKFQRKRGVHVTPTVFFNGIEQMEISSSWDAARWKTFLPAALSK
jgi:hypothetical protein